MSYIFPLVIMDAFFYPLNSLALPITDCIIQLYNQPGWWTVSSYNFNVNYFFIHRSGLYVFQGVVQDKEQRVFSSEAYYVVLYTLISDVDLGNIQICWEFLWVYLSQTENMLRSNISNALLNEGFAVHCIHMELRRECKEDYRKVWESKKGKSLWLD